MASVVQTSVGRTTTSNTTSHVINLPSGITTGNLLVVIFSVDGNPLLSHPSDWMKIAQEAQGSTVKQAVYFKYAEGSDSLTITTDTGEQSSHIVYELSDAAPPIAETVSGNSTNADPPNNDTGTSRSYLWIATHTSDSTVVASGAPTNYGSLLTEAAAGTGGASTSSAIRSTTASSENPGTFTTSNEQWVAMTLGFGSYGEYDVAVLNDPTGSDDSSAGSITWSNPTNVSAIDETYATATASGTANSHYLKAVSYGGAIDSGATILGIKVIAKKFRNGGTTGAIRDAIVRLYKAGTLTGDDKADTATNWATADDTFAYGGASDLWGTTWTPSDINNANFGVGFAITGSTGSTNRVANVDNLRVIVYYEPVTEQTYSQDSSVKASILVNPTYSRESKASLPTTATILSTVFSSSEVTDVGTDDGTRVDIAGADGYVITNFADENDNNTDNITFEWNGQSNIPTSRSTVYLQIYNFNSESWETLDSDNSTAAATDFTLTGSITSNQSNYYSANLFTYGRVYQVHT